MGWPSWAPASSGSGALERRFRLCSRSRPEAVSRALNSGHCHYPMFRSRNCRDIDSPSPQFYFFRALLKRLCTFGNFIDNKMLPMKLESIFYKQDMVELMTWIMEYTSLLVIRLETINTNIGRSFNNVFASSNNTCTYVHTHTGVAS